MLLMLVPSVIYTFLFVGQTFPPTERVAAGVPFGDMFKEALRPLFLVIWVGMMLTAATELGPGQWYANVFNEVMASTAQAGILVLVWVNGIMYLMRQFGGGISHKVSPVALIAVTRDSRRPPASTSSATRKRRSPPSPRRRCWPSAPRSGGRRCWASRPSGSRAPARSGWRSSAAPGSFATAIAGPGDGPAQRHSTARARCWPSGRSCRWRWS